MATLEQKQAWKRYKLANKERLKKQNAAYYQGNKKKINEYFRKYYATNKDKRNERIREYQRTPQGKYSTYRASAKQRGIPFEITLDEFKTFVDLPCRYCGSKLPSICLDRVDNTKGYTLSNLCPCCWDCNQLKRKLPEKFFLDTVKKIAKHLYA
jgi:hypothetical protein